MNEAHAILPQSTAFDPAGDLEAFLKQVPAKWVVYLMADEQDRPVQLLCVKNLRYSLKRRLGEDLPAGPTRRIDYRQLVRNIHWRRVDSAFEADIVYLDAARQFFPESYRGMTGLDPAWFIHVNPDARFPRYTKTIDLNIKSGQLIGPVEDKHAAARLIEDVVDWFDLCRYYNLLIQAPNAAACAYKEMGKCPAPCDGSISMDQYRSLVQWSADTLIAPETLIADNKTRMKQAAADLEFETARKIKTFIDSLSQLGKASFRYVRLLRDFKFIVLQRGPRANTAKLFLVTPGMVDEIAGCIESPRADVSELLRHCLGIAAGQTVDSLDRTAAENVGVVSFHLFSPRDSRGEFIPLDEVDEKTIMKSFRQVQKQQPEETDDQTEGVLKELQQL